MPKSPLDVEKARHKQQPPLEATYTLHASSSLYNPLVRLGRSRLDILRQPFERVPTGVAPVDSLPLGHDLRLEMRQRSPLTSSPRYQVSHVDRDVSRDG
jgi:hypothetical protein